LNSESLSPHPPLSPAGRGEGEGGLIRNSKLMVIILIIGAFWVPFALVIFAANFLANDRISHIEKPEEEAPQMGDASDATSGSLCRKI